MKKRARQKAELIKIKACTHEDIIFSVMGDGVACRDEVVGHIRRILDSSKEEAQAKQRANAPAISHAKL